MSHRPEHRSGFVAIIGAPNVGKSTLLNRIIGEKISITAHRPQTTRNRILGVLHREGSQIVFLDTPGIHRARQALNMMMVDAATGAVDDVDAVLFVIDAAHPDPESEQLVERRLKSCGRKAVLALNKIDLVKKPNLLAMIDDWSRRIDFAAVVPVSALNGEQADVLVEALESLLPEGPPLFPDDALTDMPERFIAAEMIREKIFRLTGQEIPYASAVTIESFTDEKDGALVRIHAIIHVERESQKGILIGKKGGMLKRIGESARREIERMTGTRVFLKLFVRVEKNWTRDTKAMRRLGY